MTLTDSLTDLLNHHTLRVAEIVLWHAMGLISDQQRERFLVYETEATETLYWYRVASQRTTEGGETLP